MTLSAAELEARTASWKREVEAALAEVPNWQIESVWCERNGSICCAELSYPFTGVTRVISISMVNFTSEAMRKAELIRLLG